MKCRNKESQLSKDGAPKSFNKPKAAIAQKQAWQINTQFFI
jgi:hypothetical protein